MYNQTKSEKKNKKNAKKVLFHSVFVKSDKHSGIYIKRKRRKPILDFHLISYQLTSDLLSVILA